MSDAERFMSKVSIEDDGCWLWTGAQDKWGYGVFRLGERSAEKAHRAAYSLFCGAVHAGQSVLHSCDRPACVNPSHLYLGSRQDNQSDMARKWRGTRSKAGHPFGVALVDGRWNARVQVHGRKHYLGSYATPEEASAAATEFKMRRSHDRHP